MIIDQVDRACRVCDCRLNLLTVADDSRVGHESRDLPRSVASDDGYPKIGEGGAEVLPFAQDRQPGELRLKGLKAELLEQRLVG